MEFFIGPTAWFIAFGHIIGISVLAELLGWGSYQIDIPNGIYRIPGGSLAIQPPAPEYVAFAFFTPTTSMTSWVMLIVQHYLRVRTILFCIFFVLALISRYGYGKLVVWCFDGDIHDDASTASTSLGIHNMACGAHDTLTFFGTFPLMALTIPLHILGFQVPEFLWVLAWIPWFFILAKLAKIRFFMRLSDVWMISEFPMWVAMMGILKSNPTYQHITRSH